MALPKITSPTFSVELPSNKRKIKFHPFTVKEEKMLLMAVESNDTDSVSSTIKQVMNNCLVDELDIDELATFDLEYLFLQLRAKSVDNIIELKIKDDDDENMYEATVNLDDAFVDFSKSHTNKIQLNDTVCITMKYPTFNTISKMSDDNIKNDLVEIVSTSIDKVVDGDELYELTDFSKEEIASFIESFTSKNMREIEKFFQTMPKLKLDVKYNANGKEKTKEVVGLQSFFTS